MAGAVRRAPATCRRAAAGMGKNRRLREILYARSRRRLPPRTGQDQDRSRPRDWQKHHGLLARRFMESFTSDAAVLDVIETHDDAYYAWLAGKHEHWPEGKVKTLAGLLDRMDYCLQLYYLFFKCDTQTGDKTQAPLKWFEKTIEGIEVVRIREE